ncbi:MAG: C25 family cysteine peptidase, partial [Candidatus Cloacimonadota bacterium]|nr:C25 family cysteine peptidase [Candidatus Cloacimonadota bacterium]
YSCMDGYNTGDYHPDIASGRMAIDADEADTVIEKIINYQKYPPQLNSFYDNATICSFFQDYDDYNSYEDRRFVLTCEETRDFLLENDYNAQRIYVTGNYVDPLYYNDGYYANGEPLPDELLRENGFAWDGGSSDITNAIQDGTFMVYHRDHGAPTGWGDPPFQIGNVNNLQNQNLLPFVFSMNCASGYFDMETDGEANNFESFSEQFLRNPNGGAVSLISACRNSLSGYNDYLALGMIDSIWEEFYPDFNYANSEGYMGTVLLAGFAAMEEFWYSEWSKYEMDIFHVMGDPTLQIWRQQPQSISASHNTLFTLADNIIPVSTNIEHGRASITHNGELLAVKEFDNSDFDIVMNSNLNQPAIVKLTITARDHEPYISDLSFIPENGGYVVLDSLTITDNNGNNDGQWDAGEVLELNFHLTNAGNQAISGSEVNLVSNNEFLSLSETFFQLGELQPQTAEQIEVEAELTMACSHAQLVEITILIANAENDYINSITFPVTKKPKLVTNLEPISIENLEEIEVIPFYLENIGSEELQVNLTNISNQAADISDPESYLKIPDSDDFHDLEEFSIMFWMKTIPNNNLGFAISKGVSLSNSSFIIAPLSTSSFNYYFWDANGERQFKLVNADLSYHKWNHICVTVSSTHIKIYFNGELVSEEPFISPIWNTNEDIFIGCDKNGNFQFDGHIDELAFYNIALNETEIAQKLQNSFHQEENGLISYYRLDTDFFIADLVGQNHAINVGEILFDVQGPNIITWMGAEEYDFTIEPFETIESNLIFNPFGYDFAEYSSEFLVTSNAVNTDDIIIPISWDNMLNNEPQDLPHPLCNMQIYPNPFNPETTISFTLAKTQKVSLNIYNIKGQKVRSLLPETDLEPGKHDYTWEGYDNSAQKVSSGIYFVVMKSDENGAITKKMLLLK